jgi:ATP/maltotriose-dependent transcriptional regulator MalT
VKPIELLIRSQAWDASTKRAFFAHLEKRMKDDARLGYCDRKASFLARDAKKTRAALELIDWALTTFTKASKYARARGLATRSVLLHTLGQPAKAGAAWRTARRLARESGVRFE